MNLTTNKMNEKNKKLLEDIAKKKTQAKCEKSRYKKIRKTS